MGTSKRGPAKVQSGTPKVLAALHDSRMFSSVVEFTNFNFLVWYAQEDEAVLQVDKWDSSAVRNMLDDAARKV